MRRALISPEFQRRIIPLILHAYPEKTRLIFIHVPKCAGTDFQAGLSTRYPALGITLAQAEWTSHEQLFEAIHQVSLGLRFSDTILLHGHIRIAACISNQIARLTDKIVTVIRDPMEIILSNVNYIITRILQDQESGTDGPDTKRWRGRLGIDRLPPQMPDAMIAPVLKTMLHDPTTAVPNSICYWLGNGDAQSAVKSLVVNNVEITDTRHYTAWLRDRWGIIHTAKANVSRKFATSKHIEASDLAFIESIIAKDRELYALVSEQIDASGKDAIFGKDITGTEIFE
jgi:hypothetical protein